MTGGGALSPQALAHDVTVPAQPGPSPAPARPADDQDRCLDEPMVHALAAGTLPGEARARATAHIDSCEACRDLVATAALAAGDDDAPGYHLGAELARGGMGRVVLAEDLRLGREVVIKQLLDDRPSLRRRFEREVRITARLQHPGIVPVYEAGTLRNGEPFYTMRRIHGRTLDAVAAEATTMAARLALVPRFLVAAQAVAYAHAQRVIHRDLKPLNILVGAYGEVVVVDWGLAKRLDGDDDDRALDAASADPSGPGDGALTRAGSVLGTPAYMAPEQANGDPADARSDVYALGAVLYRLLGGTPPHTGSNPTAMLVDIWEGKIEPLASRAPEVPADLGAIVTRAMALDPAARYPHAGALAADVQSFLAGKLVPAHAYTLGELLRRWLRRHRAAVLATGALVLGLGVITAVAFHRVTAERDRARSQQAASESLVGFVLDDLQPKVRDIRKLALLEGVSHEVDRYYQALERAEATLDADSLRRWSAAAMVLGDVAFDRGGLEASRAYFEHARDLLERAERRTILVDRTQGALAVVHERLGTIAGAQNRMADATRAYQRSLALHDAHGIAAPAERGITLLRIGQVAHSAGEHERAVEAYRKARTWLQAFPADEEATKQLLLATSLQGIAESERGRLDASLHAYQEHFALAERRLAAEPTALDRRFDFARAVSYMAIATGEAGDPRGSGAQHARAIELLDPLVAFDPANQAWRSLLAEELGRFGSHAYMLDHDDVAMAHFRRSLTMWAELHEESPHNVDWVAQLALGHYRVGEGEARLGRWDAARASQDRAITSIRELARDRSRFAYDLSRYLDARTLAEIELHAYRDAHATIDDALAVVRQWRARSPSPMWLSQEATLQYTRAGIFESTHDSAGRIAALRAAVDCYRELAAVAPLTDYQQGELADIEAELAPLTRRRP